MTKKDFILERKKSKPILIDITYIDENKKAPLVLFCHGYKGYKDWGAWNLMSRKLVNQGYTVVKFNFSHNGGTIDNPIDFPDLEAFSKNTYSQELLDLGNVIDWLFSSNNPFQEYYSTHNFTLMGHSRGGGIAILKASQDDRVTKLVTLAAVSNFKSRFPKGDILKQWKEEGIRYVLNGRTKQQMPHLYQFYNDYIENKDQLDIQKAESELNIPHIIFHGDNDEAVSVNEAYRLKEINPNADLSKCLSFSD